MSLREAERELLTCYGEYSLESWVKMILNGSLTLPEFQRGLAWDVEKGAQLVLILLGHRFVPPIVIGASTDKTGHQVNYVLDGQQRLTSLLLFYLGYWPQDCRKGSSLDEVAVESDDDVDVVEGDDSEAVGREWTFAKIQEEYNKVGSVEELRKKLATDQNYAAIEKRFEASKYEEFRQKLPTLESMSEKFCSAYLGFSFIKGMTGNRESEMAAYSQIFRSINSTGTPLTPMESREALNWLNPEVKELLSPPFAKKIRLGVQRLDWVRDLALCSQAAQLRKQQKSSNINMNMLAKGYSGKLENYIEQYVRKMSDKIPGTDFLPFESAFVDRLPAFSEDMERVLGKFQEDDYYNFKSYLVADIYFFGLIYWVIFKDRRINVNRVDSLVEELEKCITRLTKQLTHDKNNQLSFLRVRMEKSLSIYFKFLEKA